MIQKKNKNKNNLQRIIRQIKNKDIYKCDLCGFSFISRTDYKKHLVTKRHITIKTRTQQIENLTPQEVEMINKLIENITPQNVKTKFDKVIEFDKLIELNEKKYFVI